MIDNQNISFFDESVIEFSVNFNFLHASMRREVDGGLFQSFITSADPVSSMEIVIPVSGTIGGGQGDDQQGLFNNGFGAFSFFSFSFFGARESEHFRNRTDPIRGRGSVDGTKGPVIRFIIGDNETIGGSIGGGFNIFNSDGSEHNGIGIGFGIIEIVSGNSEIESIRGRGGAFSIIPLSILSENTIIEFSWDLGFVVFLVTSEDLNGESGFSFFLGRNIRVSRHVNKSFRSNSEPSFEDHSGGSFLLQSQSGFGR
jgi:hypothetical protein